MIPPIYVMAGATLAASLVLWGGLIYLFSGHDKHYFWLISLGLPLSAIANLVLKRQAIVLAGQAGHVPPHLGLANPVWFLSLMVLITPLVEEPIKILPLLLRPARRQMTRPATAFWTGFALGVSFGLGEAAFIAYTVAQAPQYAALPWYAFTGYFSERLLACFAHGVMTAFLVVGIQRGGRMILYGLLGATGLHLLLNAPAALYQFRLISAQLYNFILLVPVTVLALVFERIRRQTRVPGDEEAANEVVYWERPSTNLPGQGPAA